MNRFFRLLSLPLALVGLAACDPGPNGSGTAPAGVSQEQYEARLTAKRHARRSYYQGPRGGASGR